MPWEDDIRGPGGIKYGVWIPRDPNYIKKEAPKAPEPQKAPANDWIKVKVVDDKTGEVVPRVVLTLKTPKNTTEEHETRLSGIVESLGLPSGNCELLCDINNLTFENTLLFVGVGERPIGTSDSLKIPPAPSGTKYCIAKVTERKGRRGDTLKSIAAGAGMTFEALAKFNFGTDDPVDVNKHLHWTVGCHKTASDGESYFFNGDEVPGIIYIPEKTITTDLATNQLHTVRARPILGEFCIRMNINPNDAKNSDKKFRLFSADNSIEQIKTIKDDAESGDDYVDLVFKNLPKSLMYSLEIDPGENGKPEILFKDTPYSKIYDFE
jgi:hypothetical protein